MAHIPEDDPKVKLKHDVAGFWDSTPCGVTEAPGFDQSVHESYGMYSNQFFDALQSVRYRREKFIPEIVQFKQWRDKDVLEVGCGLGIDFRNFASGGGLKVGLDLSQTSLKLAKGSLEAYGLRESLVCGDGESLPFKDDKFDLVYSWGVIHHSADPPTTVKEIYRVLKPGGRVIAMIYNLRSLFVLQLWLYYGLLRGKPFASPHQLVADHVESPMTNAYSTREASLLFGMFDCLKVKPIVTPYDLRIGRRLFLPNWLRLIVPPKFGWFITIKGTKPLRSKPWSTRKQQ